LFRRRIGVRAWHLRSARLPLAARASLRGDVPTATEARHLRRLALWIVVNGKDDIMVPSINSYILQQHLPDARLILYPDSGHGSHFQFSEEFAEEAARFFAAA
jgi:pimeloyl-ACP methyl ester carboxylesterase